MDYSISDIANASIDNYMDAGTLFDEISLNLGAYESAKSNGGIKPFNHGKSVKRNSITSGHGFARFSAPAEKALYGLTKNTTEFTWLPYQMYSSCAFTKFEEELNQGESEIFDLVEMKLDVAIADFMNLYPQIFYGAGTAYPGLMPVGLSALISSTPTVGTFGGVARPGNVFAQNQVISATTEFGTGISITNITSLLNRAKARLLRTKNRKNKKLILLVGNGLWDIILSAKSAQVRVDSIEKDSGQKTYTTEYAGIEIILDGGMTGFAGLAPDVGGYLLSWSNVKYQPLKEKEMEKIEAVPTDQFSKIFYFYGITAGLTVQSARETMLLTN